MHCNSKQAIFLCLRLPFGNTPEPAEYTTVSEAAIDIGNDLLWDESWDTYDLNLQHQSLLSQEEKQKSANHITTTDSMSVETFEYIAKEMFLSDTAEESLFAHLFSLLDWKLMKRAENCAG